MKSAWHFVRAHLCPWEAELGLQGMGGQQHPRLRNPTWARLSWMTWEEAAQGFDIVQHTRPTYTLRCAMEIQATRYLPQETGATGLQQSFAGLAVL